MSPELARLLRMPEKSFFVFGPRGVGKSTWLRQVLPPDAVVLDLLRADVFLELSRDPLQLDDVDVLPVESFLAALHAGDIF